MMRRRIAALALLSTLFAHGAGCGSEPRPKTEPSTEPVPAAPSPRAATPPSAEPPEPSADELPVPQDFESEVAAQITAQNFRAELDRLERELAEQK
jgi:hypothetical protein